MTIPVTSVEPSVAPEVEERRHRKRVQIAVPVHVRPVLAQQDALAEVTRTIDFNRNGMCFVSLSNHYQMGTVLFVSLPSSSAGLRRKRFLGEVVRVERLANGAQAVAVKFITE